MRDVKNCMNERERRILELFGLRSTLDILRHLEQHGTGQYKDILNMIKDTYDLTTIFCDTTDIYN